MKQIWNIMLKYAVKESISLNQMTLYAYSRVKFQQCHTFGWLSTSHTHQSCQFPDGMASKWSVWDKGESLSHDVGGRHVTKVAAETGPAAMIWKWLEVRQLVGLGNRRQLLLRRTRCLRRRQVNRLIGKLIGDVLCVCIRVNFRLPRRRNLSVTFSTTLVSLRSNNSDFPGNSKTIYTL